MAETADGSTLFEFGGQAEAAKKEQPPQAKSAQASSRPAPAPAPKPKPAQSSVRPASNPTPRAAADKQSKSKTDYEAMAVRPQRSAASVAKFISCMILLPGALYAVFKVSDLFEPPGNRSKLCR